MKKLMLAVVFLFAVSATQIVAAQEQTAPPKTEKMEKKGDKKLTKAEKKAKRAAKKAKRAEKKAS
jgi:Ni/Co efflux regulator RcnB